MSTFYVYCLGSVVVYSLCGFADLFWILQLLTYQHSLIVVLGSIGSNCFYQKVNYCAASSTAQVVFRAVLFGISL